MRRTLAVCGLVACWAAAAVAAEPTYRFGRFGTVTVYGPTEKPTAVVLFVSGDGGWNLGVVDMARELATLDALVVGIDITHYLGQLAASSESCSYPAADFEVLSQWLQKKLALPAYTAPILVGYSSGATLVYATLVQAPPNTFKGAISLGFCPDLPLEKPLCRGSGLEWTVGPKGKGISFLPARGLLAPWIALQGLIDQVCDPAVTERYVAQVPGARVVTLPKVGHGYSVPRNWMPQFRQAFASVVAAAAPDVAVTGPPQVTEGEAADAAAGTPGPSVGPPADLPLVVLPATGDRDLAAVIVSGDGGWAGLDREVGNALVADGIPVVGLDSLRYFWTRRSPDEVGHDLARIADYALRRWGKQRLLLIGYSRGADVMPFMASRLPAELAGRVAVVALLGLAPTVDFEFHLSDWLGHDDPGATRVAPELEKLSGRRILCFFGADETDSLCPALPDSLAVKVPMEGGHHFGGAYAAIAARILAEVR